MLRKVAKDIEGAEGNGAKAFTKVCEYGLVHSLQSPKCFDQKDAFKHLGGEHKISANKLPLELCKHSSSVIGNFFLQVDATSEAALSLFASSI